MISYKIHLIRGLRGQAGDPPVYLGQGDPPPLASSLEALREKRTQRAYPYAERVYTSPLARCWAAASLLYPDRPAEVAEGLAEICLGEFEGKTFDQLKGEPGFIRWLDNSLAHPPPGGEKADAFTQRVLAAFDGIVTEMMRGQVTDGAVVTHGGVIMALMANIAFPRLPIHNWAAPHGDGFTLMTTTQMWTRDRCAEAYRLFPPEDDLIEG